MIPFPSNNSDIKNILPSHGTAIYYGKIFSAEQSESLYKELFSEIPWKHDVVNIFGKRIITKRKIAWYGDRAFAYKYASNTMYALPWTKLLQRLKEKVESVSRESYNSCLLNLYHKGEEGMGWHSDNEKELKRHAAIASISLGAERKFVFKHRETKEKKSVLLEHGSLLVMKDEIQEHWLHSLPKTKKVTEGRINLTFRTILSV